MQVLSRPAQRRYTDECRLVTGVGAAPLSCHHDDYDGIDGEDDGGN